MKAAIYARKSNADKRSEVNKSTKRQIEHAVKYAQSRNYTVEKSHIFFDDGVSGAEFLERPGLLSLMSRIDEFDAVILSEISRLGRDMYRNAIVIDDIISKGKRYTGDADLHTMYTASSNFQFQTYPAIEATSRGLFTTQPQEEYTTCA